MLCVKEVAGGYGARDILSGLSFTLEAGRVVSILGANGSGKSTLLKMIIGALPYRGEIFLGGREAKTLRASKRAELVAYVPQSYLIPFEFSVLEVVLMGRFRESPFGFGYSKEDRRIALEALERIGAQTLIPRVYRELSGGERQLVLLARALAQNSSMILMDEPVTGLDFGNQRRLLSLMGELAGEGKSIIQTTHYPDHALEVSHQVIWIEKGEILAQGSPRETITPQRIYQVYGVETELVNHPRGGDRLVTPSIRFEREGIA
ncbi:ABC transporter ATP-binding protein [Wolinella succinogenes]|uniref:ABC transporter ATP-binding protein n=1 Tax=Wolinella succinogenes TaxID=844 RepID=UPI002FC69665